MLMNPPPLLYVLRLRGQPHSRAHHLERRRLLHRHHTTQLSTNQRRLPPELLAPLGVLDGLVAHVVQHITTALT